jgi:hypothetical protein
MAAEVTDAGAAQSAFEVIVTVTLLVFASVVLVKVTPVAPATGTPPIFH